VLSVNLAEVRSIRHRGNDVRTGIWKLPSEGRVAALRDGLVGDVQADRRVHGGPDKAVYAYAQEDYAWWEQELGRSLEPALFGENLTTEGVDASCALVGERWRVGSALLEVAGPRLPCFKLGAKMGDRTFLKRFARALRPGAYLRVVEEGELGAGDPVEIVEQPTHDVSVTLVARAALGEGALAPRLLAAPQLPAEWRRWAEQRLVRQAPAGDT
jgi:MOSC domain-containing protein YiiM